MAKQQIHTQRLAEPVAHYSQAVSSDAKGKLVFISGMTARRPDGRIAGIGDIEAQTRQGCENLKSGVEDAGRKLGDLCQVDVYLRNLGGGDRGDQLRREF